MPRRGYSISHDGVIIYLSYEINWVMSEVIAKAKRSTFYLFRLYRRRQERRGDQGRDLDQEIKDLTPRGGVVSTSYMWNHEQEKTEILGYRSSCDLRSNAQRWGGPVYHRRDRRQRSQEPGYRSTNDRRSHAQRWGSLSYHRQERRQRSQDPGYRSTNDRRSHAQRWGGFMFT